MRFNYAKEGTIVFDKITGKYYKVNAVDTKVGLATAHCYNMETLEVVNEEDPICITRDTCLSFRAVYIPKDTSIYKDYTVNNGILEKGGEKVEQGEIIVQKIITVFPGCLILETKSKKEDLINITKYEPERDKFTTFIRDIPSVEEIKRTGDYIFLFSSVKHKERIINEETNEEEIAEVQDGTYFINITSDCETTINWQNNVIVKSLDTLPVYGNPNALVVKVIEKHEDIDDQMLYLFFDLGINTEYSELHCERLGSLSKDKLTSISVVRIAKGGLFIKGTDFVNYKDIVINSPKIATINAEYLIDIERTDTDIILALSDQDRNITYIKSHKTKDRGFVVTIE